MQAQKVAATGKKVAVCGACVCVRAREGMKWNTRNYLVAVQMHIVWLQEASTNHLSDRVRVRVMRMRKCIMRRATEREWKKWKLSVT